MLITEEPLQLRQLLKADSETTFFKGAVSRDSETTFIKGRVSRDFEQLQIVVMDRSCVPDVLRKVYSFLNLHLHIAF